MSTDRTDLDHLLDLLSLLPGPDAKDWWIDLDVAGTAGENESPKQKRERITYVLGNTGPYIQRCLGNPSDCEQAAGWLAQYVLMFFGGQEQAVADVVNRGLGYDTESAAGLECLRDIRTTAWRLHLAHNTRRPSHERLAEMWGTETFQN
ncbi:hypothetical protein ACIRVF_38905 [Kitasatospora sp. NPDC101157]|uniref:hypothetical protein n=1 Tax=Kitasatospora sp. NPDC101157 TaxID=3364098 RepID=UPI003824F906